MDEQITLELTDMAHGGSALGRHEGQAIFVPYGVPGDRVLVSLETRKKGWAKARIEEIVEPSPQRREPTCPNFGAQRCGGCHWQHIQYAAQLEYKSAVVKDQMARLGGLEDMPVQPTVAPGSEWEYRNNVQLHPSAAGLGYVDTSGQAIFPIERCYLMHSLVADMFGQVDVDPADFDRVALRASLSTGKQMVVLYSIEDTDFEAEVDVPVSCILMRPNGSWVTMAGSDNLMERVSGKDFRISADSFFQVNVAGAEVLADTVARFVDPQPHQTILDLYAGVGLFSMTLAERAGRIIAVEAYPPAATDAHINLQAAGADNVDVICDDVVEGMDSVTEPVDTVVLDPPRTGCGEFVVKHILGLQPDRIVYVSCDPATLARDAKLFTAGGYAIQTIQPIDMFPQTYHVESVVLMTNCGRKGK